MARKTDSNQKKWLLKMHPAIVWRIDGPNVSNPFDSTSSDEKLEEYLSDRATLLSACKAKAYMDETEILRIINLAELKFETVHPNVVNIDELDLMEYLKEQGVWLFLSKEIDRVRELCREELGRRRGGG